MSGLGKTSLSKGGMYLSVLETHLFLFNLFIDVKHLGSKIDLFTLMANNIITANNHGLPTSAF